MTAAAFDRDLYMRAWTFAAHAHGAQVMTGSGLPYVVHLGAVAMEVLATLALESFAQPSLAVACALLHDTVEDTAVTHAQVRDAFGLAVADGVQALSKDAALPKDQRLADSLRRIQAQPREIWLVKLADRTVNMEPPPAEWSAAKRAQYRVEAQHILDALGAASPSLSARLAAKIARYGSEHLR